MRIEIKIPNKGQTPYDPELLANVDALIAQKASAWTTPVYLGVTDGQHCYATDAQPKTTIVTTANVAPTLLPPNVT